MMINISPFRTDTEVTLYFFNSKLRHYFVGVHFCSPNQCQPWRGSSKFIFLLIGCADWGNVEPGWQLGCIGYGVRGGGGRHTCYNQELQKLVERTEYREVRQLCTCLHTGTRIPGKPGNSPNLHYLKSNPNVRDITKNFVENMILHEIFHVV